MHSGAIKLDNTLNINTASDFMAQYTTRQEYRYTDPMRIEDIGELGAKGNGSSSVLQDRALADAVSGDS